MPSPPRNATFVRLLRPNKRTWHRFARAPVMGLQIGNQVGQELRVETARLRPEGCFGVWGKCSDVGKALPVLMRRIFMMRRLSLLIITVDLQLKGLHFEMYKYMFCILSESTKEYIK